MAPRPDEKLCSTCLIWPPHQGHHHEGHPRKISDEIDVGEKPTFPINRVAWGVLRNVPPGPPRVLEGDANAGYQHQPSGGGARRDAGRGSVLVVENLRRPGRQADEA